MRIKSIIAFILFFSILASSDLTIFFLKDGSIVQGKVVNENQNRIFLKTDQGTIKIYPIDVIGREDNSKQGELTYYSEKLKYLQNNIYRVSGRFDEFNDSLNIALKDLLKLYRDLEVMQNEYEIDLLRLHSQSRDLKRNIEYMQEDLIENKLNISSNSQELTVLEDSLEIQTDILNITQKKVNATQDQTYLIAGSINSFNSEIQTLRQNQQNKQNQIDIISGSLANIIQEFQKVEISFSDLSENLVKNKNTIIAHRVAMDSLKVQIVKNKKALKDSTFQNREKITQLEMKLNLKFDKQMNEINRTKNDFRSSVEQILNDIDNLKLNINSVNKDLTDVNIEIRKVNKKVDKSLTKIDEVSEKINNISAE